MTTGQDTTAVSAGIERLVQRLDASVDSPAKAEAQELVRLLLALYGNALSRVLDILRTEQGGSHAVLDRLAKDPLVGCLLVLHDLHPDPVDVRVARALMMLQPHLPADTAVHLVAVEGDSVRVRAERTASARISGVGLRLAIERALHESAPELVKIHIDGLDDSSSTLIQIRRAGTPAAATIE